MDRIIYKFYLDWGHGQVTVCQMPRNAKVLNLQVQNGQLVLWALIDPTVTQVFEPRRFLCVGTGLLFNAVNQTYVGTCQHGEYVWHVFEAKKAV